MPLSSEEKLEHNRESDHRYYQTHRKQRLEYAQSYRKDHKQQQSRYDQDYYLAHKEDIKNKRQKHHVAHRDELIVQMRLRRQTLRQQLIIIYTDRCCFCNEKVLPRNLALHHINLDGPEERKLLGKGMSGFRRSWIEAIEHRDSTRYATSHMACHTRFHKGGRDASSGL